MGYSHNWQRPIELPDAAFVAAVDDIKSVLASVDIKLAGFDGTGQPVFDRDHVVFNGAVPNDFEPFEISRVEFDRRGRKTVWTFCKTEHRPYDMCVKISLIIFAHHLGELFVVGSDGDNADWVVAKSRVEEKLGYGATFCIARD